MPEVKINEVTLQASELAEPTGPDSMPTWLFQGTVDGVRFASKISFEVDGRDIEVDHISGPHVDVTVDQDVWDAFLVALNDVPQFAKEYAELNDAYFKTV